MRKNAATLWKVAFTSFLIIFITSLTMPQAKSEEASPQQLNKEVDHAAAGPGDVLTYTITLENLGDETMSGIVLTDLIPEDAIYVAGSLSATGGTGGSAEYNESTDEISWTGDLAAGEDVTIIFQVSVDEDVEDGTIIVNTASIVAPELEATAETVIWPTDIVLDNGFQIVFLGVTYNEDGTSTWSYYVEELPSAQDLSNWVLELPDCTDVVTASPHPWEVVNPDPNAQLNGIKWQTGAGFEQGEFTVTLTGQWAVGTTQVAAKGPDVAYGLIAGPVCEEAFPQQLKKTVDRAVARPGDVLTYTITLENLGDETMSGIVLTDPIPEDAVYVAGSLSATGGTGGSAEYNESTDEISWTGDLEVDDMVTITFQVTVNEGVEDGTPIVNTASADGLELEATAETLIGVLSATSTVDQNDPLCADATGIPTFCTIQAAINLAAKGGTIKVKKGTYNEDLTITTEDLELKGEGKKNTVIKGQAFGTGPFPLAVPNIDIRANGVSIHNFTIEGPDLTAAGQYASGMVLTGTDIEIYKNDFLVPSGDPGSQAIQTWNTAVLAVTPADISGLKIYKNRFKSFRPFDGSNNLGYEGPFINPQGGPINTAKPVIIEKNKFEGELYRAIGIARGNVSVEKNRMQTDLIGPIVTLDFGEVPWGIKVFAGNDVQVEKNKVKNKPGLFNTGIYFEDSMTSDSEVEKNKVMGTAGDGMNIGGSSHVIEKNKVKGSGDNGLELNGSDHTVEKNKIKKSGNFDIVDNSAGSTFEKNKCKTSDPDGLCK